MKKLKFLKAPTNDFFLRIYAVILAVLIWFVISITLYPTITKTVNNISVSEIVTDGTIAMDYNLTAVSLSRETVSATIFGKRYEIGDISSKDLEAQVDIQGVNKPGEYELSLNIVSKNNKFEVKDVNPSTIKVKFDSITEKEFPLEIDAPSLSVAEGYLMEPITSNPEKIKISGPKEEMDKITKVVARTNDTQVLTSSLSTSNTDIILLNGDTVIDKSAFTFSTGKIELRVPILMEKKLPFKIEFQNEPPNFDLNSLKYTLSESEISIAAPSSSIATLGEIHLGYLDLSKVDIGSQLNFEVSLPENYKNLSGTDNVTVDFDWNYYSSKTISIDESNIYILNSSTKYNYEIETTKIRNIKIIGPRGVIDKISSDNIVAEIDMLEQDLTESTYSMKAKVYSPENKNVWAFGDYTVTIDVSAK